jgi:hypothetical protein
MKTQKILCGIVLVAVIGCVWTGTAEAQTSSPTKATPDKPAISVGKLIRSGRTRNGTPKFSLLDSSGNVTGHVIPVAGLNLGKHVNRQVGVTARNLKRGSDNLLYILAQNVTVLDADDPKEAKVVDIDEAFGLNLPEELTSEEIFADLAASPLDKVKPVGAAVADDFEEIPFGIDGQSIVNANGMPQGITDGAIIYEDGFHDNGIGIAPGGCSECGGDGTGCLPSCGPCGPSGRFWIRGEYLLWWTKGMDIPALVSTGPSSQLPQNAGVIGQTGTEILYGGGEILDSSRNGGRFRMGRWCDFCNTIGWDVDLFFLSDESETFSQLSTGAPILARPFFNTQLNRNDSELVAFPGIVSGSMDVTTTSEMFSVSPRVRYNLCCFDFYANPANACSIPNGCGGVGCPEHVSQRLDLLLGYRYTNLDESLRTRELLSTSQNGLPTTFDLQDSFTTENDFHGFEIGLQWERYRGPWSLEWLGRVALGNNREIVTIDGNTSSSTNGVDFGDEGGLLALSSNIGTYKNSTFAAIPEMDLTLGYKIGPSLQFLVGYTLLYWNDVVRPGDHIDTSINPNLIPPIQAGGEDRPTFTLNETDIWAQGLSFGLDYRW